MGIWGARRKVGLITTLVYASGMTRPKNFGFFLIAIYLIIVGLMGVFNISLGQLHVLVPLLALVAGICLLIGK